MNFLGHLTEWIILSHLQYLFVVELEYEPRWILLQNPWHLYYIQLLSIWHMVGVPLKGQRWENVNVGLFVEKGRVTHYIFYIFLRGEFHGQRSMANCSPSFHKESDMTEQLAHTGLFEPLGFKLFVFCISYWDRELENSLVCRLLNLCRKVGRGEQSQRGESIKVQSSPTSKWELWKAIINNLSFYSILDVNWGR